jgi:hypothetical protein
MDEPRQQHAAIAANRWPVWFGLQFFFMTLGLVQLWDRVAGAWAGSAPSMPVLRLLSAARAYSARLVCHQPISTSTPATMLTGIAPNISADDTKLRVPRRKTRPAVVPKA